MIHAYTVANVVRYRATRDGIQREFDTRNQAMAWVTA